MRSNAFCAGLLLCGLLPLSITALAQEKKPEPKPAGKATDAKPTEKKEGEKEFKIAPVKQNAALEKIKSLAGDWVQVEEAETAAKEKRAPQIASSYHITGDGSAICETMMAGTPYEMITMYHADGDGLMLTHYCASHNQPQMKAAKPADPNKIEFKFAGGANIDPARDSHMHDLTLTIVDADHIKADWTYWADGKSGGTHTFNLVRRKAPTN